MINAQKRSRSPESTTPLRRTVPPIVPKPPMLHTPLTRTRLRQIRMAHLFPNYIQKKGINGKSDNALSRILHLLALHKDAQTKLREEIRNARRDNGGKDIGYDDLVSLPYLDAICRETLRLYPPLPVSNRTARKDVLLPLSKPIKGINADLIHEIFVPKGTNVNVSALSCNRNPQLWGPDSYEWKPERWLNPLPQPLVSARIPGVYSNLMSFIRGGRACLGFKFSQLEMKVVLALLLENLEFSPTDKPIVWQFRTIVTPNIDLDNLNSTMPMIISTAQ